MASKQFISLLQNLLGFLLIHSSLSFIPNPLAPCPNLLHAHIPPLCLCSGCDLKVHATHPPSPSWPTPIVLAGTLPCLGPQTVLSVFWFHTALQSEPVPPMAARWGPPRQGVPSSHSTHGVRYKISVWKHWLINQYTWLRSGKSAAPGISKRSHGRTFVPLHCLPDSASSSSHVIWAIQMVVFSSSNVPVWFSKESNDWLGVFSVGVSTPTPAKDWSVVGYPWGPHGSTAAMQTGLTRAPSLRCVIMKVRTCCRPLGCQGQSENHRAVSHTRGSTPLWSPTWASGS